jgi:two-component system probable response regulator PhcQ
MAMQEQYDYKRFAILYVDDEEKSLKSFARAFGESYRILTAANAKSGLAILEAHRHEIGILMTDQRMPGEKGVWLLEKARHIQPRLIRILVTAYSDMEAAIAAVNAGAIYKFITKPWDPVQLDQTLRRGMEFFIVQRERDQLLKEKMSVLHNMMIADRIVSLGLLAAGLSHHIRNALVAVKTFLDLAPSKMQEEKLELDGLRHPEFWREYYQNVQGQIHKINSLLKDLGIASETVSSQFGDQVRLHDTLAEVLQGLAPGIASRNLRIENEVPDSLPLLTVDCPKFSRLFELLLKDEMVSLPAGSTIHLSATTVAAAPDARGTEIEVRIRDNGPGLPKQALRSLFDPFAARSQSPMEYGINLMACYFIVHHHGGEIRAESEEGRGTTFTLRLPTNPNQAPIGDQSSDFLQKALLNDTLWEKLASE